MQNVADVIEKFIVGQLFEDEKDSVDVQRRELAQQLSCAPSQITYTLMTRFTPEKGYEVISKRGNGGFIRIIRLHTVPEEPETLPSGMTAEQMVAALLTNKMITAREARLMNYNLKILGEYVTPEDKCTIVRKAYERISEDE
jgi:transcriptional regulator CtsR